MKKIISSVLIICMIFVSVACLSTIQVSAAIDLTEDQIEAKNYPVPEGYNLKSVFATYDTADERGTASDTRHKIEHSTEDGTFYDTASMKFISTHSSLEVGLLKSAVVLDGAGFMFWYKSDVNTEFRLRMNSGNIVIYGTLNACPEGQWATYYYYGKAINMTINPSSWRKDFRAYTNTTDNTFNFNIMYGSSEERVIYVDEFYTFAAPVTPADSYDNDEQFQKYSLLRMSSKTTTNEQYFDDGSVTLSSTYGETTSSSPITINYDADLEQAKKALAIAKEGSGYLQLTCEDISCYNSSDVETYAKITVLLSGIDKQVVQYCYGAGNKEVMLINVKDVESLDAFTGVKITVTGTSIKNVSYKIYPITVYHYPSDKTIIEAEDLSPVRMASDQTISNVSTVTDTGNNRTCISVGSSSSGKYTAFNLPELAVGEYDVSACCLVSSSNTGTYNICINNLKQIDDVVFGDSTYPKEHYKDIIIGKIKISKNYSDGASVMKFTVVPKKNEYIKIDYFMISKTDTVVEAESSSNFVIKDYPEMDRYEVKTVLNNFDEYICSSDSRYYNNIQIAGYVGDGNAYNLNSRCTQHKGNFDNNGIVSCPSGLDGNGLRFWFKSGTKGALQLKNSSGQVAYTKTLLANTTGEWYTFYYTDFVENGDLSNIISICFKPESGSACYFDEVHTIQEKLGSVSYELNGDGTASVVGYDLRLEDITIDSTYNGCPVTTIKEGALSNSTTLKSIVLPDSITTIEKGAFENDLNLKDVTFGNKITTISQNAFNNCPKLGTLTMPDSLINVDVTAFSGCASLIMVVNADSYMKNYALTNLINYRSTFDNYTYFSNNQTVSIEAYNGNKTELTMPETIDSFPVTLIDTGAFKDNTVITKITIPSSVVKLADNVFAGCTSLKNVDLNNVLETIGESAFSNCTVLEKLSLAESITSIADNSFDSCTALVADVVKDSYSYTYANTHTIKQIPETTSLYKYSLINYEASIISYTGNGTTLKIPDTIDDYKVISIAKDAFSYNTKITYVNFSENCNTIEENAFLKCTSLKNFAIGNIRNIKAYAFGYCTALADVTIPNVVVYSDYAFYGCTKLNLNIEKTQFQRSAMGLCNSWHVGINLGNCFCAYNKDYNYGDVSVEASERLWGAPNTTKEMIDFLSDGGFDVLRLAVTWRSFIDDSNGYKIDPAYLARVKEVIDWCIADDMYVVLNLHHDTVDWLGLINYSDETTNKFTAVWQQIAEYFKDYDEHLIFESMNEERYKEDWDANSQTGLMTQFNNLQKAFYNTVRATGGYNNVRYLMFETYGAQAKAGHCNSVWYPSLEEDNHVMMSVHFYTNNVGEGCWSYNLGLCKTYFTDKGIPCVLGETGMQNYADMNDEKHSLWADALMNVTEDCGMKILYWDDNGGFAMFKRVALEWMWPSEIATIMKHAYPEEEEPDNPIEKLYGDTNADGEINIKDAFYLAKYLVNGEDGIDPIYSDVNGDETIDAKDILLLKQYLAGYNIVLGQNQ